MNMDRIKYRYWEHEVWDDPTSPLVARYTDIVTGCDPTVAVGDFEFCTGLKDKNGNLIYEGDVIFDGFCKGTVEWQGWFWSASSRHAKCPLDKYALRLSEIIGNVHQTKNEYDNGTGNINLNMENIKYTNKRTTNDRGRICENVDRRI